MAAPLVKVAALFFKTLVKPLAGRLKTQAKTPGTFRNMCHSYGQFHHNLESRVTLRLMGHHAKRIKPLQEDDAVNIGATVFSEAVIFTTGAAIVVAEIARKERIDAIKKAKARAEEGERRDALEARFLALEEKLSRMAEDSRRQQAAVARLVLHAHK